MIKPYQPRIQIIIVMGVSGSGKTTLGRLLAESLHWPFYEGDNYHPLSSMTKMSSGIPLTDEDREPWLAALKEMIRSLSKKSQPAVITCSALKQAYRDYLTVQHARMIFVYLKGSDALIRQRLQRREAHFMKDNLLDSQFKTLEEPEDVLTLDLALTPESLVEQIKQKLTK